MNGFGEIRSILSDENATSKRVRWSRIMAHAVDRYEESPKVFAEQWMPYILEAVGSWPDAIRVAPRKWVEGMRRGSRKYDLVKPLVRALDTTSMTQAGFQTTCASDGFEWVRHLVVGSARARNQAKWPPESAKALGASTSLAGLTSLEFVHTKPHGPRVRWVFRNPFMENLKRLTLTRCTLTPGFIKQLGNVPLGALEELRFRDCPNYGSIDWTVLSSRELPSLHTLDVSDSWYDYTTFQPMLEALWMNQITRLDLGRPRSREFSLSKSAIRRSLEPSGIEHAVMVRALATI